jgi:hypothetical protein
MGFSRRSASIAVQRFGQILFTIEQIESYEGHWNGIRFTAKIGDDRFRRFVEG